MSCPKCNCENPEDVQSCSSCDMPLAQAPACLRRPDVRISRLAVISLVLGLFSPFALFAVGIADDRAHAGDALGMVAACAFLFTAISAVVLGIAARARMGTSCGRLTGRAFAMGGILIPVIPFTLVFASAPMGSQRSPSFRIACSANLSRIARSMLLYASDYDGALPRAGAADSEWSGRLPDFKAPHRRIACNLNRDGSGGQASISASLFLLVKYAESEPNSFVCQGDSGATTFDPTRYGVPDGELITFWDFGPEPSRHCSYSYHMPYGPYALTRSCDPNVAVAADRNPWQDSHFVQARDFRKFDPAASDERRRNGNSAGHRGQGQNVLFLDCHVSFEKTPFCGIKGDNIYTRWEGPDTRRGRPPKLGDRPKGPLDSFLVNDPPPPAK